MVMVWHWSGDKLLPEPMLTIFYDVTVRETDARTLTNKSKFWAGQVENWAGWVESYKEHIRDICFRSIAPEI